MAAAVGGLTTVVADGTSGLLVDSHDAHDWANALRRLIDDPALTARLGEGALRHAHDFSPGEDRGAHARGLPRRPHTDA
ncbi:glycosyltransferase [Nocardioides sp. B-3]|uniref:glycosyltransferase n=1 Tax=Nocardioides sp. B-3 TaxID=2895565 RepID=UPI00300E15DE